MLVLEWGNLGKQIFGVCMIAGSVLMVPTLKDHLWGDAHHKGGVFAVIAAFGFGVVLLLKAKQRYTFDRRIGQLTMESKGLLGQSQYALPLSQIEGVGFRKTRNDGEGTLGKRWAYHVELLMSRDGIALPLQLPPLKSGDAAYDLSGKICTLLNLERPAPESVPPLSLSEKPIPLPFVLLLVALVIFGFGFLVWKGMH
ncbi:MAG TPA: hypothetical protein V6D47_04075 [Oscillatoriaceae cyanobacterium]